MAASFDELRATRAANLGDNKLVLCRAPKKGGGGFYSVRFVEYGAARGYGRIDEDTTIPTTFGIQYPCCDVA